MLKLYAKGGLHKKKKKKRVVHCSIIITREVVMFGIKVDSGRSGKPPGLLAQYSEWPGGNETHKNDNISRSN